MKNEAYNDSVRFQPRETTNDEGESQKDPLADYRLGPKLKEFCPVQMIGFDKKQYASRLADELLPLIEAGSFGTGEARKTIQKRLESAETYGYLDLALKKLNEELQCSNTSIVRDENNGISEIRLRKGSKRDIIKLTDCGSSL